jgi:hypothetical protein
MASKNANHQKLAAWLFGTASFVFMIVAFFVEYPADKEPIVRFMASLCTGLFGFFLTGSIRLFTDENLSGFEKVGIKAVGGTALFVLVWMTWPNAGPPPFIPKVRLKSADLFILRNGSKTALHFPLVEDARLLATSAQQLGANDQMKIRARFDSDTSWTLIGIDPEGTLQYLASDHNAQLKNTVDYPMGDEMARLKAGGWYLFAVVQSSKPIQSQSDLSLTLGNLGTPPAPPDNQWIQTRGPMRFASTFLDNLDARLVDANIALAVFLKNSPL